MKRIRKFSYVVKQKETVTLAVKPVQISECLVAASQNGKTVPNTGTPSNPVFSFLCDEVPGNSHFFFINFQFLPEVPDNAAYKITLKSDDDSVFEDLPTCIKEDDTDQTWDFRFKVEG